MKIEANAEIEAMAHQLAVLRGGSVEEAVAAALRAELLREPKEQAPPSRLADLTASQRAKVTRMLDMVRAAGPADAEIGDRTAALYDEQGLPR